MYSCEVALDVRVGPDGNRDTVERLTNLRQVTAKMVESSVPAIIIGRQHIEFLEERKHEGLEFNPDRTDEREAIEQRLQDVVDAAKLQGRRDRGGGQDDKGRVRANLAAHLGAARLCGRTSNGN